ncbi:solute:sodium symporter (SSS) family transporter [Echinicola pacifica]|uniref:Solute:sodium symporter (SSS) family transporter n=1 Tax=Echinicola pacifica TaxID=346377 RepID=A0A918PQ29_9BACT|nr:sodium/solute symporter [Echinicola pacifica]GGZ19131.1 solute:sodium symporter (SSS) family transporter [Echinicola pacifica]
MTDIQAIDLIIIGAYLLLIVVVGLWYSRKSKNTSSGYFLAGKSLTWGVIGASLFASNISTVHLVGLAESGFKDGIVWGNFEWFSAFELLILAFVFVPFYLRSNIATLPEFLEQRYDSRSRVILAIFSILAALFMHIGVSFYAGAIVFEKIFGLDILVSIIIIAAATGVYTIIGGLTSVVVTETVQTVILILGSLAITVLAIYKLPEVGITSYEGLKNAVDPDRLKAVSFDSARTGFTFMDMLTGHLVLGIWYWCTDQTIVQRVLGAKSEKEAKLGAIFAGFLKILPVFIMVVPGILAFALFKDEIGADTKSVLPIMILNLLPVGLKGLMIAALLAAVMSSVAAALNSCSTLIVFDVFAKINPGISDKSKVRIGRITGVVVLVMAVAWSPFLGNLGAIFELINQMFSIFAPSIVAVFLWGVISTKGTSTAAFWTLLAGSTFAAAVFVVEKYIPINDIPNYISSADGLGLNWLRQTFFYFIASTVIYSVISYFDPVKAEVPDNFYLKVKQPSRQVNILSAILVVAMIIIYIFFY